MFILSISTYAQLTRNIKHPLIVADTMHYVVAYYPQGISWVINSLLVFRTMSREISDNEGFYMYFTPDSTHIVWQYVSKKDDPSLYERFNPLSSMETSSIYIVNAKSRKKLREQVKEI